MYKVSNGLHFFSQFKLRNWVLNYSKIEWYWGIINFTFEYFSLLKEMLKYFLAKVIPEDLVSLFFDKDLKCF